MTEQNKKLHIRIHSDEEGGPQLACNCCMFLIEGCCESSEVVGRYVRCTEYNISYELISGELHHGPL